MTDHLPECHAYQTEYPLGFACICPSLRACEQRVLDAAREAVMQALGPMDAEDPDQYLTALAAIDALREKP